MAWWPLRCAVMACSFATALLGFEEKPWLGNQWEFFVDTSYSFSRFKTVANSTSHLQHPSNDNLFVIDLGFVPLEGWEAAVEVEFAQTPRQSLGRRSAAAMVRMCLLDDIMGDAISLTVGGSIRQTAFVSLKDISCPSSARWEVELHSAIGKEWSSGPDWMSRVYGIGALGQGSRGSPWTKAKVAFDLNKPASHSWEFYSIGYWGFGRKHEVNIEHFKNWGSYDHSSIDLGVAYLQPIEEWGHFRFDLFHRIYARVYPRGVTGIMVAYHLPFSLL